MGGENEGWNQGHTENNMVKFTDRMRVNREGILVIAHMPFGRAVDENKTMGVA